MLKKLLMVLLAIQKINTIELNNKNLEDCFQLSTSIEYNFFKSFYFGGLFDLPITVRLGPSFSYLFNNYYVNSVSVCYFYDLIVDSFNHNFQVIFEFFERIYIGFKISGNKKYYFIIGNILIKKSYNKTIYFKGVFGVSLQMNKIMPINNTIDSNDKAVNVDTRLLVSSLDKDILRNYNKRMNDMMIHFSSDLDDKSWGMLCSLSISTIPVSVLESVVKEKLCSNCQSINIGALINQATNQ